MKNNNHSMSYKKIQCLNSTVNKDKITHRNLFITYKKMLINISFKKLKEVKKN